MTETQLLTMAASLVATLFGLLVAVLGWLGNKIYTKLEEMGDTMHVIAGDLHDRINGIDGRLIKVETKLEDRS